MSSSDPRPDVTFEWLRRAHRAERAPEAVRRRAIARGRLVLSPPKRSRPPAGGWFERRWLWGGAAAGAVACVAWLAVSRLAVDGTLAVEAEPGSLSGVAPSAEPPAPRGVAGGCPEPLPKSFWDPEHPDLEANGFSRGRGPSFVVVQTDCGPVKRRYVFQEPAGAPASAALIVLHDAGESPEHALLLSTRGWFDGVADRHRAVVAYANGGPLAGGGDFVNEGAPTRRHAGLWQTDEGAHPALDDFEYLRRIVDDLRERKMLAPSGEVFLAGHGSGAVMALAAAARAPERYSGVAAFLPTTLSKTTLRPTTFLPMTLLPTTWLGTRVLGTRVPASRRPEDLAASARHAPEERRLRSVFVALPAGSGAASKDPSALATEWAAALGSDLGPVRVAWQKPGLDRIDSELAGGVALRILRLSAKVDPFPLPGFGDPIVRAASEARPFFFDGPEAAWAFFQRPDP
jgi:predicted esterase